MRRYCMIITSTCAVVLGIGLGVVLAADGLDVERIAVCTGIENREPTGEAMTFSPDVGRLWCFTKITGIEADTNIVHVWNHQGKERARVRLPVRPSSWRTWSSKSIDPRWTGEWRIVVEDQDGHAIGGITFSVTAAGEAPAAGEE